MVLKEKSVRPAIQIKNDFRIEVVSSDGNIGERLQRRPAAWAIRAAALFFISDISWSVAVEMY